MKVSAPPRDWFSTAAGLTVAVALAAGLAWLVFGPSATRAGGSPWQLVWVNIVSPSQPPPKHSARVIQDKGGPPPPAVAVPAPGHS